MRYKLEQDYEQAFSELFKTGYNTYATFTSEVLRVMFRHLSLLDLERMLADFKEEAIRCGGFNKAQGSEEQEGWQQLSFLLIYTYNKTKGTENEHVVGKSRIKQVS